MNFRETLASLVNEHVRVLTSGATPLLGWETGTLLRMDEDSITLADDETFVLIPIAAIQRVRWSQ